MPKQWLYGPITTLRTTLAAVPAFRTFVGAADATAAAKSIYDFENWAEPFPVAAINAGGAGSASIEIDQQVVDLVQTGQPIRLRGSSADDGLLTVRSGSGWDGDYSTINVAEAVTGGAELGTAILQPLPCCTIGRSGGASRNRRGQLSWTQESSGGLWMSFLWEPGSSEFSRASEVDDRDSQFRTFCGLIQSIVDGCEDLFGTPGYLNCKSYTEAEPPTRVGPEHNAGVPFWFSVFELAVGG